MDMDDADMKEMLIAWEMAIDNMNAYLDSGVSSKVLSLASAVIDTLDPDEMERDLWLVDDDDKETYLRVLDKVRKLKERLAA